jgi:hypothetical protein
MYVRCPVCYYATSCKKTETKGLKCSNCGFDLESHYFDGGDEASQKAFLDSENARLKALQKKAGNSTRVFTSGMSGFGVVLNCWIIGNVLYGILISLPAGMGGVGVLWIAVTVLPAWLLKSYLKERDRKRIKQNFRDKALLARSEDVRANNSVMESVRDSAQALLDEYTFSEKDNVEMELAGIFSKVNQTILKEVDVLKEIQARHPQIADFVETRTTADANRKVLKDLQKYFAS